MTKEEAINILREQHDKALFSVRTALETIIPELRESEDERIRKELIEFILWVEDRGLTRQDFYQGKRPGVWLAWLQKQKEQKPVKWSEEDEKIANEILDHFNTENAEWFNWFNTRFKSLRPSWKPTEDEVRLINTSISFLKDFADKGYENAVECIDWLKSKLNGNTGK